MKTHNFSNFGSAPSTAHLGLPSAARISRRRAGNKNRKRRTAAEPIIEEPPREWRNQPALMPGQQKRTAYLPLIWIAGQDWKITSLLCACHALVMRVVMRLLCALL